MRFFSGPKHLLGIVVGERSLLIAQAGGDERSALPPRIAEFAFPDQLTMDQPAELGLRLADFLALNNFTASAAVFGLPARKLVTRQAHLPPADSHTCAQLLWLQTATHFSEDLGPMVFDFTGELSPDQASTINLIALQRSCLDRLLALSEAAGLKAAGVTATITALAHATAEHEPQAMCLSLRSDGAELAFNDAAGRSHLKHIASAALDRIIRELRRTAIAHPAAHPSHPRAKLVLWDDCGLGKEEILAIADSAGTSVVAGSVRWLDASALASSSAAPLALLYCAREVGRLSPDFLRPRINPPVVRAFTGKFTAILAAVAAVLVVALGGYADILHLEHGIAAAHEQLDELAPQLQTARPFASQMQFAKTFQPVQATCLTCLKDLTLAVPQESQTYLTSFALDAEMKGTCVGHSASEQDVLDLLDKLNSTGRFTGLSRRLSARPKGNAADVLFNISFTYAPGNQSGGNKPSG